jgi:hypothetical protein
MLQRISGAMGGNVIDFAPSGIIEEVSQNVRTLLMTAKYSVPLDRELGIDASFLDRPAPEAMARLRVQIAQESGVSSREPPSRQSNSKHTTERRSPGLFIRSRALKS